MVPKIIEHDVYKFREELSEETIKNLAIDGGAEKVKEALSSWGVSIENKRVAVPILMVGNGQWASWLVPIGRWLEESSLRL